MCRSLPKGGRRCNGGDAGNARRRVLYAEDCAHEALAARDDKKFVHYAKATLAHREHMREHGHPPPPLRLIPDAHVVRAASALATFAHEGQYRRDGRPYIVHPADVAQRLERVGVPAQVVAAGWLHDVPEDTDWSVEDLRTVGFPPRTVRAVDAVTHRDGESYLDDSMPRAVETLDSAAVKDADNQNNTSDRKGPTPAQYAKQMKRNEKYLEARRIIKRRLYETQEGQRHLEAQFAALEQRQSA